MQQGTWGTSGGVELTDELIEQLSAEAAAGHSPIQLRRRMPPGNANDRYVVMVAGLGGTADGPDDLFLFLADELERYRIGSFRCLPSGATIAEQAKSIGEVVQSAKMLGCESLGVVGESLGATSLVFGWPPEAQAGCLLWPVLEFYDPVVLKGLEDELGLDHPLVHELGSLQAPGGLYGDLSGRLGLIKAPMFLVHGLADEEVPWTQTTWARDQFPRPFQGQVLLVDGGDHGLKNGIDRANVISDVADFFHRNL